ncbi:MAG TPA: hypothetical protein VFG14_08205 [Chthoniobacteraceae bacterium]|nr:hypothetical protein [Chthoniobacteraceae bacterium]
MSSVLDLLFIELMPNGGNGASPPGTKKDAGPLESPSLCEELFWCHVYDAGQTPITNSDQTVELENRGKFRAVLSKSIEGLLAQIGS